MREHWYLSVPQPFVLRVQRDAAEILAETVQPTHKQILETVVSAYSIVTMDTPGQSHSSPA